MLHQHLTKKVRLSVDCTNEERRYIKMLAAREDKTISEYLVDLARKQMPKCALSHVPNADTINSIEKSEQGIGIEQFDSIDDFWKSLGG